MNRIIITKRLKKKLDKPFTFALVALIYDINVSEEADVSITMTLTTPGCPLHDSITSGVRYCVQGMEEINNVDINLVWAPDKMTLEGLRLLGR
nr:iron-sulfur cluster assembly protein [Neobacillus sp. Marseille-Q6967]